MATRRSPGEGSITTRSDGRWQGSIQVEGRRRFVYGKTAREVKAKLQTLQKEVHQSGCLSKPGSNTLNDLLDLWIKTATPTLKPRTVHDYECLARRYIRPSLGHLKLTKVTPERLQAFYSDLMNRGLERVPSQVHCALHRALNLAVIWQMLPSNPSDRVVRPHYRAERHDVWTVEQASAFLAATSQDRHGPMWAFLASTGCRIGEALALKWDAVDLEQATVAIMGNLQRIGRAWVTSRPKAKAGERSIALPLLAVDALRRQRALQATWRLRVGPEWNDGGLVFSGLNGCPIYSSTVHRALASACARLDLPVIGPHQLRHLHASLLVGRGLPVTAVSARLGHASPSITMTIYAHALKNQDQHAAQLIQEIMG